MDLIAGGPLQITLRRYGPTLHLTLAGELDIEAEPAFAQIMATLPAGIAVIACDLYHVHFMDVVGVRCILALKRSAEQRGLAALVCNWQSQPLQLLNLLGGLERDYDVELRSLQALLRDHADAQRALGIDSARRGAALVGSEPQRLVRDRRNPDPPPAAR
ncbi:STAS domain-containing protein [Streptomyces sp. SPB162]|uniref:STAS domain-containing protein n=1 Tax=Streptomyces sp. SPB162 TaxID=2940560 RepID=UPI002407182B|nr:STAS domain-containing protein [Streptomyces sp. SPB162]MDF9810822.1 anti-anti-sigma factor [Streptomyces sp. SPB162]